MNFDVFISYHTKSSSHITEAVCNALENQKIKCWYAPRNISGSYAKSITQAINKCKIFLIILNKESSYSEDVLNEINLAVERVRKGEDISIIPFQTSEEDISDDAKYYLGRIHWVDAITPPLEQRINELTSRISYILKKDQRQIDQIKNTQTLTSNFLITLNNFFGRENELKFIENNLSKYGKIFIEGMGGIGKSELVKKYLSENKNKFDKIIYASYENNLVDTIIKEQNFKITNFCRKTDENGILEDQNSYFQRKMDKINELSTDNTIIVIDNFDAENDPNLKELLKGNYKLIIITRNDFSEYNLPVLKLAPDENEKDLIRIFKENYKLTITNEEESVIKNIFKLLSNHPLAIKLIASTMNTNRIKPNKMFETLKNSGIDKNIKGTVVHNLENYTSIYQCISAIFDISALKEEEKQILKQLNILPKNGISFEEFMNLFEIETGETINHLIKKNFIIYNNINDNISLHLLISSVISKELTTTLDDVKPLIKNLSNFYDWNMPQEKTEKYAEIALKLYEKFKNFEIDLAPYFVTISNYLLAVNRWDIAEEILKKAIQLYEQDKEKHIEKLINAYGLIGYTYYISEKNVDANITYTLKIADLIKNKEKYYKNYGDTLRALAIEYLEKKEIEKAKKYIDDAYIYLKKDKETPKNFWASYYRVSAKIYKELKNYSKALEDIDKCYQNLYEMYKEENLDISSVYTLKGEVNIELKEYPKAIEYLEKAVNIRLKYRSKNNITVLRAKEDLALAYMQNKNYQKAKEIYEEIENTIKNNFCNASSWLNEINKNIADCQSKI